MQVCTTKSQTRAWYQGCYYQSWGWQISLPRTKWHVHSSTRHTEKPTTSCVKLYLQVYLEGYFGGRVLLVSISHFCLHYSRRLAMSKPLLALAMQHKHRYTSHSFSFLQTFLMLLQFLQRLLWAWTLLAQPSQLALWLVWAWPLLAGRMRCLQKAMMR